MPLDNPFMRRQSGPPPIVPDGAVPRTRPAVYSGVQPGTTYATQATSLDAQPQPAATTTSAPGPNVKVTDGSSHYLPGYVDPGTGQPVPVPKPPGPTEPPTPVPMPKPPGPPGGGNTGIVPPGLANYQPPGSQFSPGNVVSTNLNDLLSSGSRYIENARQRGREEAASRGLLNSSIAAGAAERSGIEASMPILDQIMGLNNQREAQANQSLEAQRDRQFQSEFALLEGNIQDWLHNLTENLMVS
jgi:hypothetical protein